MSFLLFSLGLCAPLCRSLSPLSRALRFLCCSEGSTSVTSVFLSLLWPPSAPTSTQQALQVARGMDEELEDLKTLAKSWERPRTAAFWPRPGTRWVSGKRVQSYSLLPTFLESEQQSLTTEWKRAKVTGAPSKSPSCSPQTLSQMLAIPLMTRGDSRGQQELLRPVPQPLLLHDPTCVMFPGVGEGQRGAGPKKKPFFSLWAWSGKGAAASGGREWRLCRKR